MFLSYYTEDIAVYFRYVKALEFDETPDYDFLRQLFGRVLEMDLKKNNHIDDSVFEWSVLIGKYLCIYILQEQQTD
jgi:casein kinase 1